MASVTASDWIKGISLSVLASIIGGASKLAIRKSWLIQKEQEEPQQRLVPTRYHQTRYVSAEYASTNSTSNIGRNVIREGNLHNYAKQRLRFAYCLRGSGLVGMTFLNPLCCVLAMNYASPSILAPFSGLTLVWIVLFSKILIDEQPTSIQITAATLIVVGEVIVAIFGDHTNDGDVSLREVHDSYQDPLFILYFISTFAFLGFIGYTIKYRKNRVSEKLYRFCWGVSGGTITGLQNFLKDFLTIVKATTRDNSNNEHGSVFSLLLSFPWYLYLMLFLAIATAFGGLLLLTACMKQYDATYSSSMFVGSFVVNASIMSAIHYNTFANLVHLYNYLLYPFGLLVLMGGVVLLIQETKIDEDRASSNMISNAVGETRNITGDDVFIDEDDEVVANGGSFDSNDISLSECKRVTANPSTNRHDDASEIEIKSSGIV